MSGGYLCLPFYDRFAGTLRAGNPHEISGWKSKLRGAIEQVSASAGLRNTMKFKILSLIAAGVFAASSVFGGGKACCATHQGKMECSQIYAKLNLTPAQKTKLDALQAQCEKEGCTKNSMDKFMHSAKRVLSQEQYAQLKTECENMQPPQKTKG